MGCVKSFQRQLHIPELPSSPGMPKGIRAFPASPGHSLQHTMVWQARIFSLHVSKSRIETILILFTSIKACLKWTCSHPVKAEVFPKAVLYQRSTSRCSQLLVAHSCMFLSHLQLFFSHCWERKALRQKF